MQVPVFRYADRHNQVVAGFLISQLQEKYEGQKSDIKSLMSFFAQF